MYAREHTLACVCADATYSGSAVYVCLWHGGRAAPHASPNRERYVARELARRTGQATTADADDEDDLIVPDNLKVVTRHTLGIH